MKRKQTKFSFFTLGCILAVAVGVLLFGGGNVAKAYVCPSGYEYHESDGQCWKVDYHQDTSITPAQQQPVNGVLACADGSSLVTVSGKSQCSVQSKCGSGVYHSDTNTCWAVTKNSDGTTKYTVEDTNKVAPTYNNGTQLSTGNADCTDGFDYLGTGNGTNTTPGCYKKFGNGYPCGPDQNVGVTGGGKTATQTCEDSGKSHLIPLNKKQSDDPTSAAQPVDNCSQYTGDAAKLAACQAGQQGKDCTQQATQELQDACNNGNSDVSTPASKETFGSCGKAQTVLVGCDSGVCGTTGTDFKGVPVIACVLKFGVSALTVLVGVGAVGGIAWEAVQYARARDDQSMVSNARQRIRDIVIGLIVYVFLVAVINWLVPGGIIG